MEKLRLEFQEIYEDSTKASKVGGERKGGMDHVRKLGCGEPGRVLKMWSRNWRFPRPSGGFIRKEDRSMLLCDSICKCNRPTNSLHAGREMT